jgi:hypothetical protein
VEYLEVLHAEYKKKFEVVAPLFYTLILRRVHKISLLLRRKKGKLVVGLS